LKGATEDAGRIGLVIVVCGMAGSMIGGIVLDKTHAYKVRAPHHIATAIEKSWKNMYGSWVTIFMFLH
jgi:hypothetical protein